MNNSFKDIDLSSYDDSEDDSEYSSATNLSYEDKIKEN